MAVKLIPLSPGSKSPPPGVSWTALVSDITELHREWRAKGCNLGFPAGANNAVIVDFDDKEVARLFYKMHRDIFGPIVETRHGIHAYFSGDTRPRKLIADDRKVGDIRAGNTYCVFPDSRVRGWVYRFVRGHEWGALPPFPADLFPDVRKEVISKEIRNVAKYVMTIESIQGRDGSAGLVRAAARCRDGGLTESQATILLLEWNTTDVVQPAWSQEEIARAISRVYRKEMA